MKGEIVLTESKTSLFISSKDTDVKCDSKAIGRRCTNFSLIDKTFSLHVTLHHQMMAAMMDEK